MFIFSYRARIGKNQPVLMETVGQYMTDLDQVKSTADAGHVFIDAIRMHEEAEEVIVCLCLNASGRVTGMFEHSGGGNRTVMFDVGGIVRKALMLNAVSIILAHNHPGGSLRPSSEDIDATKQVQKACDVVGIRFLDHFIISSDGLYTSLKEEGYV